MSHACPHPPPVPDEFAEQDEVTVVFRRGKTHWLSPGGLIGVVDKDIRRWLDNGHATMHHVAEREASLVERWEAWLLLSGVRSAGSRVEIALTLADAGLQVPEGDA